MFIYLAHPIDQATKVLSNEKLAMSALISHLKVKASNQGHGLFVPGKAYQLPHASPENFDNMEHIDSINDYALFEANAVLAVLWPGVPTLGTPSEVEKALHLNKPVCIVTTRWMYGTSVQIGGWERRGAQIRFAHEHNGVFEDYAFSLADALGSLPRPEELNIPVEVGPPSLLARGAAANLQPGKYQGDAGIDLAINEEVTLMCGQYKMVGTGVHVAVPDGYFGLITARSSTWAKFRVRVVQGVIDSGYRGELMVGLEATREPVTFEKGMRLAQFILLPTFGGKVEWVDELPEHERGEAGYGSSGH